MNYPEKYPHLYQLLAGYFNQDWKDVVYWKNIEPNYQSIVRLYKTDVSEKGLQKTISELKLIIDFNGSFGEEDWRNIVNRGLGCGIYPPGIGLDYKEWLKSILVILEEPMEKTKNSFIPKMK